MNYAVILSGGVGSRMNMDIPKQYIEVNGKPVLLYTLETFEKCSAVDRIIIVAAKEWRDEIEALCSGKWKISDPAQNVIPVGETLKISKFTGFADPGATRQGSILNGLMACGEAAADEDLVIIHDAVRPLVSDALIKSCFEAAAEYGGAMPVLNVTDTVYYSESGASIDRLLPRDCLFAGQAPEAFRLESYRAMNLAVSDEERDSFRGTSEIAYRYGKNYGVEVRLIPGEDRNYKITTRQDLERFRLDCRREND